MKKYQLFLFMIGIGLYDSSSHSIYAKPSVTTKETPNEEWNIHQSENKYNTDTGIFPSYHKKRGLYPSKHQMHNPLRKKGWHTHPDPYIEEGGVYTNSEHPALTDDQSTMREYTSGTPNHYVSPPSILLGLKHSRQSQQKVRITDPSNGYAPPISLPPS